MTEEAVSVSEVTEDEPRRRSRRGALWLLVLLSLMAVGGVALAWSPPANNELRVAATEQEFLEALDAMKTEWYCTYDGNAGGADSVGYTWASCNLGSDGTTLNVEYWQDLDGALALTTELRERDPIAFSTECLYIGDHVMVTWSSASATHEDVQKVAAALDGWKQPAGQRDCP
jgi:hypothetical protein